MYLELDFEVKEVGRVLDLREALSYPSYSDLLFLMYTHTFDKRVS